MVAPPVTPDTAPPGLEGLIRDQIPIIDVRAPGEFSRGHFPQAKSAPILTDDERHQVGIEYRLRGPEAAVRLGQRLVSGETRDHRIATWAALAERAPGSRICCWRGGQRSTIAAQWLGEIGIELERVPGGFKAMRAVARAVLAQPQRRRWLVVGGMTGSRKTAVLRAQPSFIDIEDAAHHRGSSFGGYFDPQPAQVTFENRLATAFLGVPGSVALVEDESRNLGSCVLPEPWVQAIRGAPLIILEASLEERVSNIYREYIAAPIAAGRHPGELAKHHQTALRQLRRRLGDQRWRRLDRVIATAYDQMDASLHQAWIAELLRDYYDPTYEHQTLRHARDVVHRGDAASVREFLRDALDTR